MQFEMLGHRYGELEGLVHSVLNELRDNTWMTSAVAPRKEGAKSPRRPKPVPFPGEKPKDRLGNRGDHSVEDVKAYLDSLKPKGAAA